MRALLIHANPYQRVYPVPAYGLERLKTAAAGSTAEIELWDPYLMAEDPLAATAELVAERRPDVVGFGIRVTEDLVPIASLTSSEQPHDLTWFLPEIRRLRDAVAAAAPDALLVAGGAGFSANPGECLDYLGLDWGVVGAGEDAFPALLERRAKGQPLDGIPGLIRRGEGRGVEAYTLAPAGPTVRDPLYSPCHMIPVRTRIGCAMECSYCAVAALRRTRGDLDLDAVLTEIAETVEAVSRRAITPVPLFFANDEFNLPDERHPIAVLRGIVDRGLAGKIRWRSYFNPTPFSDELCELILATNGVPSITVDTAAEPVMVRNQKPFRARHLDQLMERLTRHELPAELVFIFGLPGETHETIAQTTAFIRALPDHIEVEWAAGARVYAHTPLAAMAAAEPERLVGGPDPSFFEPVIYAAPMPPRELAAYVDAELDGLPNVRRYGLSFAEASTAASDAYRVVLTDGDPVRWRSILDEAAGGNAQLEPADALQSVMHIALWHRRFALASAACKRLVAVAPRDKRRRLRAFNLVLRAMALTDRSAPEPSA